MAHVEVAGRAGLIARLTDKVDRAGGTEFYPSLAPDGRTFVYSSDQSGNLDIYMQRVGGKNPTNLTNLSKLPGVAEIRT